MWSYLHVPTQQGKENSYRGEKQVGRTRVNRVHGFLLAESLPGKKSVFFLLGSVIITGHESSPFWFPDSI